MAPTRRAATFPPTRSALGYTQDSLGRIVAIVAHMDGGVGRAAQAAGMIVGFVAHLDHPLIRWAEAEAKAARTAKDIERRIAADRTRQAAEARRAEIEGRRPAIPRRATADAKRATAEQRRAELEASKHAAEEARRVAAEAKRAAAEQRRAELEASKRAAEEARRVAAEQRRAAAEQRRAAAEQRRVAAEQKKQLQAAERERRRAKLAACRQKVRAMPHVPAPECEAYDRVCYPTKGEAVRAFIARNSAVTEAAGGADLQSTRAEFDSINEKYERRGKRSITRLGDAIAAVIPGRPYCLDAMDLEALNETTAGQHYGPFELPDVVLEDRLDRQYEQYVRERAESEAAGSLEDHVTDDTTPTVAVEPSSDVPF